VDAVPALVFVSDVANSGSYNDGDPNAVAMGDAYITTGDGSLLDQLERLQVASGSPELAAVAKKIRTSPKLRNFYGQNSGDGGI